MKQELAKNLSLVFFPFAHYNTCTVQKGDILHSTGRTMIKNTVLKQKQEKERLLSLSYIERTKAVHIPKWLNSDLIKVVVGPRRSGKSVFSLMLLHSLPFAYFNFDDETISRQSRFDYDALLQELHSAYRTPDPGDITMIPIRRQVGVLNRGKYTPYR